MKSEKNRTERAEDAKTTSEKISSEKKVKVKSKKKKTPAEKLDEANVTKAAKEVTTNRTTKYQYPEGTKTAKDKKDFRRKARAAMEKFDKDIRKLTKSEDPADKKQLKKVQEEFQAWKEENLSPVQ